MKRLYFIFLLLSINNLQAADEVKAQDENLVDKTECALHESTEKLGKVLNDKKEGTPVEPDPCKGEIPPVSKRLDDQLNKDAKTIKNFFGFDE